MLREEEDEDDDLDYEAGDDEEQDRSVSAGVISVRHGRVGSPVVLVRVLALII